MKKPNILIIYTDQQRWDALGANGNPHIYTPNLDRLARDGINFERCFVQNPVCTPSRVSFFTGQYPSKTGIACNGVRVPEHWETLPSMLKRSGYKTANIGKLHFIPHANRDHRQLHPAYGFDHLEISDALGCYEDSYRAWVRQKAPEHLDHISLGLPPATARWHQAMNIKDDHIVHPQDHLHMGAVPFPAPDELTHSAFVAEQTNAFIEENKTQRWMCVASFYSPHSPWIVPQRFLDLYDPGRLNLPSFPEDWENKRRTRPQFSDDVLRSVIHGYYAMISEVDHYVGSILDTLKREGLFDNTVIVFHSDHGDWLGQRLMYGKSYPGTDAIARVPLIVHWPQGIRNAGRKVAGIVEAIDIAPTLLECAGMQVAPHLQGKSFFPALRDLEFAGKESALMEYVDWKNLRTDRYRYLVEQSGAESLFDLQKDPLEYVNVAQDPAYHETVAEMRLKLLLRLQHNEQPLPREWQY